MFVFKKRNIIIVSVLLATILTFIICVGALYKKPANDTLSIKLKVVVDAGHGGVDGGVTGVNTKVKESDLNLKVAKKLEHYLISGGMNVVLTRNNTAGLYGIAKTNLKKKDMAKRKEIINNEKPDVVISIHMNKYAVSSRRGAQVFYKMNHENSKKLGDNIQSCFNSMNETVKQSSALKGDYYILNCSDYTSVICECGFLSNPEDEKLLITEEYQDKIAYTIFKGMMEYFAELTFNYC